MGKKQAQEYKVIKQMIQLYCKKKHKHKTGLCTECEELLCYANKRIEKCPYKEEKTFCSGCKTHCYKKDMREKIKTVMKFSGPRMLVYNPLTVIKHILFTIKRKIGDLYEY